MNSGKIDLKDGFCVSCGRESGVIYRSCPFCDEQVWHPPWRKSLFGYIALVLPAALLLLLLDSRSSLGAAASAFTDASSPHQMAIVLPAALLMLPYENRTLIHPSSRSRTLGLLNALAASALLLACALLLAVSLRFSQSIPLLRVVASLLALGGAAAPLVLNCPWWRLLPAALLSATLALL